ncbi:MAG: Stk1 family PASTA domain-containing Ser/Thr kinase [Clostridia bacterium]|nr:Stk1 family PASTA domain-containing Ser/Thr kinase [Clostridia bacterium]
MSEKILADRYKLVEQIGIGGMAIVYRAIDMRTGHNVAIKVLRPEFNQDAEFVGRFQREAEAASKMTHHNIVNLLDVGMDGNNRYLVMEYVQGKTLKQLIQEKGRLNPIVAAQITIRILSALQHAHENGIIHRDIKPQNILVHSDGHIKVSDFGIARMANSSTLSKGDSVMGSVHYFSPEQASGHTADVTSDIYSVGVVLYEMLTGRVPFDGDSPVAIAMQHLHNEPTPIATLAPDVPPGIIHVCMMAMEKNPRHRYQSAVQMASELRKAVEGRTGQMQPRMLETVAPPAQQGYATASMQRQPSGPVRLSGTTRTAAAKRRNGGHKGSALWWIVSLLVAGLVFYGLYLGGVEIYDRVANTATVPDMVGSDQASATRLASRAGLNVEIVEVNHATVSAGVVIMQTPEAETSLRKGDTVVLTVSKGPSAQMVPSLTGSTVDEAIALLQTPGLVLAVTQREVSADVAEGIIISQLPEAGTQCQAGDTVQVVVSGGCAYVPNLSEKTLEEATELLTSSGLALNANLQYQETTDASLHGTVALQSPAAGTQVILGTSVTLTIYRVPSLTHAANVTLELTSSTTTIAVRVTLVEDGNEITMWENTAYGAGETRQPTIELTAKEAGTYDYRVYIDGKFAYQKKVTME